MKKEIKKSDISKILSSKEISEKVFDSLSSHLPKSSTEYEFIKSGCFYGLSIAMPIIDSFFKIDKGLEIQLKDLQALKHFNINRLSNHRNDWRGVNALNVGFHVRSKKIFWNQSFEDFLFTKELMISDWHYPMQDLIVTLLISRIIDCYFEKTHHLKVITSLLSFNSQLLDKHNINNSVGSLEEGHFLLKNEAKFMFNFEIDAKDGGFIFSTKKRGYPYIRKFAQDIPSSSFELVKKMIVCLSPKSNQKFINSFKKKKKTSSRILILVFNKVDIPDKVYLTFDTFYKNFENKAVLLNELNIPYESFANAMEAYKSLCIDNCSIKEFRSIRKPGLINELINYSKNNANRGPILKKSLGIIPYKKIFLSEPEDFMDYRVEQVLSKHRLKKIGKELRNCLRGELNYHQRLIRNSGENFLYFKSNSNKKNSFLCLFELKNRKCEIKEMGRYGSRRCTETDQQILSSFLTSKGMCNISPEAFDNYLMSMVHSISKNDFESGQKLIEKEAPILTALFKELSSYRTFSDEDFSLLSRSHEMVLGYLNKQIENYLTSPKQLKLGASSSSIDKKVSLPF